MGSTPVPCRVGSTKAHALLRDVIESGGGLDAVNDTIVELEKTMRLNVDSTRKVGQIVQDSDKNHKRNSGQHFEKEKQVRVEDQIEYENRHCENGAGKNKKHSG